MTRRRSARLFGALALAAALAGATIALAGRLEPLLAAGRDRMLSLAAERAGPELTRWLAASAQRARADGVAPMPAEIRRALSGFVDESVLDRVRYRIGGGKTTSVLTLVFLHPHTRAIGLDGVIVFRDAENAAKPRYWVHEIAHLEQIRRWGPAGFAERYIRQAGAVEAEAWDLTERYVAWALRRDLDAAAAAADLRGGELNRQRLGVNYDAKAKSGTLHAGSRARIMISSQSSWTARPRSSQASCRLAKA